MFGVCAPGPRITENTGRMRHGAVKMISRAPVLPDWLMWAPQGAEWEVQAAAELSVTVGGCGWGR